MASKSHGELAAEAQRLLRTTVAWAQAARQLGVRPDPTVLWKETEALAASAADPREELDRIWADAEETHEIEDRLLRRKVVDAVLAVARTEEVPTRFEELAKRRQRGRSVPAREEPPEPEGRR